MHGAGSKAVRQAIETHQPLLSLHGHIHQESASVVKIGRTTSVNPAMNMARACFAAAC